MAKGQGHHVAPARGGRAPDLTPMTLSIPTVGREGVHRARDRQDDARLVDDQRTSGDFINSAASLPWSSAVETDSSREPASSA